LMVKEGEGVKTSVWEFPPKYMMQSNFNGVFLKKVTFSSKNLSSLS